MRLRGGAVVALVDRSFASKVNMQRERITALTRKQISDRASARFFYLVDAIARAHEPTQAQLDGLESSYRSTGEFVVASPEFQQLLAEVHGHGSRQLGTLIRPTDETREGFDVDLIARLQRSAMRLYDGDGGPTRLLNDLHSVLERYAKRHDLRIQRWERCVTLEYAGGMCADITPVIDEPLLASAFGDTHGRVPDCKLKLYDWTNPRGYIKFFNAAAAISPVFSGALRFSEALKALDSAEVAPLPSPQEVFDRLLCKLIQLLKLHRNVAFGGSQAGPDASPTSVFLTTLTAKAYAVQAPLPHDSPLDLLLDIVETLPDHFDRIEQVDGTELWYLQNPSAPHDNLAAGMNSDHRQAGFGWWHARVIQHLSDILDAIESRAGMDTMLAAVKAAFGERAARAIQTEQSQGRATQRHLGRVTLIPVAGVPMSAVARQHNFFGEP